MRYRKRVLSLTVLLVALAAFPCFAGGDLRGPIDGYLYLLCSEKPPTKNDFFKYEGAGSEDERMLEYLHCEEKGWLPTNVHPDCLKYLKESGSHWNNDAPSLYFEWLRGELGNRITAKSRYVIEEVEEKRGDFLGYDLITIRLDGITLVFDRMVDSRAHFGELRLVRIDGKNTVDMLKEYIRRRTEGSKTKGPRS
jgi:hypothetical protein